MEKGKLSVSELFDSYESDFTVNCEGAKKCLDGYDLLPLEEKAKKFERVQWHCQEALKCIKQMEIEVTSIPPSYKDPINNRIKVCRSKYEALGKQIVILREKLQLEQQQHNLFKDQTKQIIQKDEEEKNDSVNSRLLATGDNILQTGSKLDQIQSLASDTHETVLAIHGTLRKDGEMLTAANKKAKNIDGELSLSHTIINSIRRREFTDKMLLFSIILVLFLLDCSVFYLKVFIW